MADRGADFTYWDLGKHEQQFTLSSGSSFASHSTYLSVAGSTLIFKNINLTDSINNLPIEDTDINLGSGFSIRCFVDHTIDSITVRNCSDKHGIICIDNSKPNTISMSNINLISNKATALISHKITTTDVKMYNSTILGNTFSRPIYDTSISSLWLIGCICSFSEDKLNTINRESCKFNQNIMNFPFDTLNMYKCYAFVCGSNHKKTCKIVKRINNYFFLIPINCILS